MGQYKYQMHTHTLPCSACAHMSPTELCEVIHKAGYQGAVLTNHFYHGNCGIDRGKEWTSFVEAYERDYQACVAEGKKYDLDILFGIEEVVAPGLEILCYGITPKTLYDNPHLRHCSLEEFAKTMRQNGAVLIQAHPFREVFYIPKPGVLPLEFIDGIEVYNRGNATDEMNQKAMEYARRHPHLLQISGGDTHRAQDFAFGGIQTSSRIKTAEELAVCLQEKNYTLLIGEQSNGNN